MYQECRREVFWPIIVLVYILDLVSIHELNKLIGYADDSTLMDIVASTGVRITVAESVNRDLGKASEWCDHYGMKIFLM